MCSWLFEGDGIVGRLVPAAVVVALFVWWGADLGVFLRALP